MSLEVQIQKRLPGFCLDVAFTAGDGPAALLGASGSGKSMTLRCIAGVERPDSGFVRLNGRTLYDSAQGIDLPPQQRRVGLLFQHYALFPHMTLRQNLLCALRQDKALTRAQRMERCAAMEARLRLAGLERHYPYQLSGGQQQRAALARILLARPALLLLDEPFSALDSFLREGVEAELAALLAEFCGPSLLVTHSRDEAYRLCGQLAVLEAGRVLRCGPTRAVFADPGCVAAARLTGCKNILPCTRLGPGAVRLAGWGLALQVERCVPEGCRHIGVRAHDLVPAAPGGPNCLPVRAVQASEDPFDWELRCASPDGSAALCWKAAKQTLAQPCPPLPAALAVPPGAIMPLLD